MFMLVFCMQFMHNTRGALLEYIMAASTAGQQLHHGWLDKRQLV